MVVFQKKPCLLERVQPRSRLKSSLTSLFIMMATFMIQTKAWDTGQEIITQLELYNSIVLQSEAGAGQTVEQTQDDNVWTSGVTATTTSDFNTGQPQYLLAVFDSEITVKGVLVITDDTVLHTGSFEVRVWTGDYIQEVDNSLCPNMNGVGTNGESGAFNCDKTGSLFVVICTIFCEDQLAIRMVRIWTKTAISVEATPTLWPTSYVVDNDGGTTCIDTDNGHLDTTNSACIDYDQSQWCGAGANWNDDDFDVNLMCCFCGGGSTGSGSGDGNISPDADLNTIFQTGWVNDGQDNNNALWINQGMQEDPAITLVLSKPAQVYDVLIIVSGTSPDMYFYVFSSDPEGTDFDTITNEQCFQGSMTDYLLASCNGLTGLYFVLLRKDKENIRISKMVVIGTYCDEIPLSFDSEIYDTVLEETCLEFEAVGTQFAISPPDYDQGCIADYPSNFPDYSADITYEFWDVIVDQEATYITHDGPSNKFVIEPNQAWFDTYLTGQLTQFETSIRVTATPANNPGSRSITGPYLTIFFSDITSSCTDAANGGVDNGGDGCDWYETNLSSCGYYDDDDFIANNMCCYCDGGEVATSGSQCPEPPVDPCLSTVLLNPGDQTLQTKVYAEEVVFTFPEIQDQVSIDAGDATGLSECGERTYTLVESENYLAQDCTSDCRNLILHTIDRSDIGERDFTMKIELTNFPDVTPLEIVLNVIIEEPCLTTVLLSPGQQPTLETKVFEEAVLYTFPEIQDQTSFDSGDLTGLLECGERVYTLLGGSQFLEQDCDQSCRELILQTESNGDAQSHYINMQIELLDYPEVMPLEVILTIIIEPCFVESLEDPDEIIVSPFNIATEFPIDMTIQMPRYTPTPSCGYFPEDVVYSLQTAANRDEQDDWIEFQDNTHAVVIEVEDDDLHGQEAVFKMVSSFTESGHNIVKESQFTIVFPERVIEEEVEEESEEIEEVQQIVTPITQESQEETQETSPDDLQSQDVQMSSENWDGWKSLLANLDLDFELPDRNNEFGYVPTPPTVSIEKISVQGQTTIKFSEPVFQLRGLTTNTVGRMLALPYLQVQVVPGENSDPAFLDMSFEASFTDNQTISMQLDFKNAPSISSNQPEDVLKLSFWGPYFDQQDGLPLEFEDIIIYKPIPPQVVPGLITDTIEQTGDSLQFASFFLLSGNGLMNILIAGSLSQVWGMINNLQMIMHAPLINVQFPGNAFMIYEVMIPIATFEIIPTDKIYPLLLPGLPETDAFSLKFERLGFEWQFTVMNMGMLLIGLIWFGLLYLLYQPCKFLSTESSFANSVYCKIDKSLFWGGQILYVQEAYLEILISVLINIIYFQNEPEFTWEVLFSGIVTVILTAAAIVPVAFLCIYIAPNLEKLDDDEFPQFKQKYYPMYEMLVKHPEPKFNLLTPRKVRAKELTKYYSYRQDMDESQVKFMVNADIKLASKNPAEMGQQCKLLNKQFEEEYEAMTFDQKREIYPPPLKGRILSLLWCVFFYLRRIAFVVGVIFLIDYPYFQIILFIMPTLFVLIMIGLVEPLPSPFENRIAIYDNCTIIVLSYCLLCYTDFVSNAETRYTIGYVMILLTVQNVLTNLYVIGRTPVRLAFLKMKRLYKLGRNKKGRNILKKQLKKKLYFSKKRKTPTFMTRVKQLKSNVLEIEHNQTIEEQESSVSSDSSLDHEAVVRKLFRSQKSVRTHEDILRDNEEGRQAELQERLEEAKQLKQLSDEVTMRQNEETTVIPPKHVEQQKTLNKLLNKQRQIPASMQNRPVISTGQQVNNIPGVRSMHSSSFNSLSDFEAPSIHESSDGEVGLPYKTNLLINPRNGAKRNYKSINNWIASMSFQAGNDHKTQRIDQRESGGPISKKQRPNGSLETKSRGSITGAASSLTEYYPPKNRAIRKADNEHRQTSESRKKTNNGWTQFNQLNFQDDSVVLGTHNLSSRNRSLTFRNQQDGANFLNNQRMPVPAQIINQRYHGNASQNIKFMAKEQAKTGRHLSKHMTITDNQSQKGSELQVPHHQTIKAQNKRINMREKVTANANSSFAGSSNFGSSPQHYKEQEPRKIPNEYETRRDAEVSNYVKKMAEKMWINREGSRLIKESNDIGVVESEGARSKKRTHITERVGDDLPRDAKFLAAVNNIQLFNCKTDFLEARY